MPTFYIILEFLFASHFTLTSSEWVEIQQKTITNATDDISSMFLKKSSFAEGSDEYNVLSSPSTAWLAYQRERFNIKNTDSPRMMNDHVDDFNKEGQTRSAKRHLFLQTKTKIKINSTKSPLEHVDATIKNDISDHIMGIDEFETNANVDLVSEPLNNEHSNRLMNPTVKGFLKFFKSIQASFLRSAGFSIERKIQILKKYRDKIMRTIESRFKMLWQPLQRKRIKRGIFDDSNLSFPPEAAIISINFLTFAVFLIKLVLQVIHIVKSKHYTFSGFGVNTDSVSKVVMRN